MRAGNGNAATAQEFVNAGGCAGNESRWVSQPEFADVFGVKAVHVFLWRNASVNHRFPNGRGQRRLHKDAVRLRIAVGVSQQFDEFGLRGDGRQNDGLGLDAESGRRFFLHSHVNLRGGVFAHPHKQQFGADAVLLETGNLSGGFRVEFGADPAAVKEIVHYSRTRSFSISMTGIPGQRASTASSPITRILRPS